eukprot:TRINITY_DN3017_c0_g1_i1.p1 TRINITY_DN3017_c0_g1~~TRINITY_DN3017_c0_g1_i1.p1  ORF type:complete len:469 (+),score=124.85 TRINITY_DN3017_c0_g1_i1:43-1407(+)
MSVPKIKVLSRSVRDNSIAAFHRNPDPKLHPFERAREYTRALNATKLERVFAKPFVGSLDAHTDGVHCLASVRGTLSTVCSGSYNGELVVWNVARRTVLWKEDAHSGFLRGITSSVDGRRLWTCGDDKIVKLWDLEKQISAMEGIEGIETKRSVMPISTFIGDYPFIAIDHHWSENMFVTCGTDVHLWDETRSTPVHSFNWGADTMLSLKFNPVETSVIGATGSDRSITLFDIRTKSPLKKLLLDMNSNAISWNPMEAFNFSVANEDQNCYTFDMRKLDEAALVHRDHVSAVMSIDYSPTGKEFVTGSYDKTLRIFPVSGFSFKSREVYHTRRMQRVFCVKYTADNKYVLSGSDDTNVRIWKARAHEKLEVVRESEQQKMDYHEKIKAKFAEFPEIRRIARHRNVPKAIYNAKRLKHVMVESRGNRLENQIKHSKPGRVQRPQARKDNIAAVIE